MFSPNYFCPNLCKDYHKFGYLCWVKEAVTSNMRIKCGYNSKWHCWLALNSNSLVYPTWDTSRCYMSGCRLPILFQHNWTPSGAQTACGMFQLGVQRPKHALGHNSSPEAGATIYDIIDCLTLSCQGGSSGHAQWWWHKNTAKEVGGCRSPAGRGQWKQSAATEAALRGIHRYETYHQKDNILCNNDSVKIFISC